MKQAEQVAMVMARLDRAHKGGTPVQGRVLNPVNAGFAVGVAGIVCFLPERHTVPEVRHTRRPVYVPRTL